MAAFKSDVLTVIFFFTALALYLLNDPFILNTDIAFRVTAVIFTAKFFADFFFRFKGRSIRGKRSINGGFSALSLLMLSAVVIMCWNRLFFFQGYFEIPEGGEFHGNYIRSVSGPFRQKKGPALIVSRENRAGDPVALLYLYEEGMQRKGIVLSGTKKRGYRNMTFRLLEKEFGATFFFSLKRSPELPLETFSFNFPLNSSKTSEFSLFGLDGKVKASFSPGNMLFSRDSPVPDNLELLLTYRNEKPVRLGVGDYIMINTRVLTLTAVKRWDGVIVEETPLTFVTPVEAARQFFLR